MSYIQVDGLSPCCCKDQRVGLPEQCLFDELRENGESSPPTPLAPIRLHWEIFPGERRVLRRRNHLGKESRRLEFWYHRDCYYLSETASRV